MADVLTKHFYNVSSTAAYSATFYLQKTECEKNNIDLYTNETLRYVELCNTLKTMKFSAPDFDFIYIEMIKHLNRRSEASILKLYNIKWTFNNIPDEWRKAHIIPLLKPEKDPLNSTSYRSIFLTNYLCKLIEKMVNNRLQDLVESQNLMASHNSDFAQHEAQLTY